MKIALDAGHGSDTLGKRTPPLKADVDIDGDGIIDIKSGAQYREHYANVGVCVALDKALRRCGFDTLRVSWNDANAKDDANIPLAERQAMIRNAGCEISISIHFNAYGDGSTFNSASGVGTFIHSSKSNDSRSLAEKVQKHLTQGVVQKDRGVKEDNFAMCNCSVMGTRAAILCELAFMTNEYEASLMTSADFWAEAAEEICRGICEYTNVPYKGDDEMSYEKFLEYMKRYEAEKAGNYTEPEIIIPGVAKPTIYRQENGIHICEVDVKNFKVEMCNERKRSAADDDYCSAGFFGTYEEDGITFTLPVAHLVCDFTAKEALVKKYCTERGEFLTATKYQFDASKWTYDNSFAGKAISTLLVSNSSAKIVDITTLHTGLDYAISGVPIMRNGADVTFATYVRNQGWDAGSLYATWHVFVGLKQNDTKIYVMAMRTTTGNMILTAEAYRAFLAIGMHDVIKLDGGGSAYFNVGGKVVASTTENRLLNTIIQLGASETNGGGKIVIPSGILKNGSTGDDVRTLQSLLAARGFNCGAINGIFDAQTEKAVRAFQTANNLLIDGMVGNQTWGALL